MYVTARPARTLSLRDGLRDARARACAADVLTGAAAASADPVRRAKIQALADRGATPGERAAALAALARLELANVPAYCATWRPSEVRWLAPGFLDAKPEADGVAFYVRHGLGARWLDNRTALPIAA